MAEINPCLAKLIKLADDLLNPERFGYAVTREIRDEARDALGLPRVEMGIRKETLRSRRAALHEDPADRLASQAFFGMRPEGQRVNLRANGKTISFMLAVPQTYRDVFGCDSSYDALKPCPHHGNPDRPYK